MNTITIIIIAFGLAMDAFAVSISRGLTIKHLQIRNAFKIALFFGAFQGIMPVVGWLAGMSCRNFISGVDHWIAFSLLTFIGIKMIYESFLMPTGEKGDSPLNIYPLLILSVATSIDALAVGLSLSFIKVAIITPAIIIGIITFLLSFSGVYIGNRLGHFFERKLEVVGGLILIGIGIRILVQHLT